MVIMDVDMLDIPGGQGFVQEDVELMDDPKEVIIFDELDLVLFSLNPKWLR